jgi:carbon monoxide dehydrogenase subunit G
MRRRAALVRTFAGLCLCLSSATRGAAGDEADIAVAVHRHAGRFEVDVDFRVSAAPQDVWRVMTDYDHMDRIVSNVVSSHVIARHDEHLEVASTTRAKLGPWEYKVNNVREIRLTPVREIRSKVVSGDLVSSEFVTTLVPDDGGTRVTCHGLLKPDRWIPPLVGPSIIESETRKQYAEIRSEVLRRRQRGEP